MANMSYCRFENTAPDMKDCTDALGEMEFSDFEELSETEQNAARKLFTICKMYVEVFKQSILPNLEK
jgi:hypothetical protein